MAPDSHLSTSASAYFSKAAAVEAAAAAPAPVHPPVAPAALPGTPKGVASWDTQVGMRAGACLVPECAQGLLGT